MKEFLEDWAPVLIVIIIMVFAIYGWVANIVHLINDQMSTGLFVVRVIGIFMPPLGAVLGYV